MLLLLFNQPAASGVTANLAATLEAATVASSATVRQNITATLAATLAPATLSSNATVTPAGGAVTATLAVTLADATLSSAATVGGIAPPVPAITGGGGIIKTWRQKRKEADALREAIEAALRGPEPVTVKEAEKVAEVVQRDWTLPQPVDFSTETAHLDALAAAVDRITAIALQNRRQADELQRRRVEKAKALAAKVQKVLRLVDLADAA